jgi:hypothetical protein
MIDFFPKYQLDSSLNNYLLEGNFVYNYHDEYVIIYRKFNDTVSDDGRFPFSFTNKLEIIGIYNALTKIFYKELYIHYKWCSNEIDKKLYVGQIKHANNENLNTYDSDLYLRAPTYFSKISKLYHEYDFLLSIHYTGKYTLYFILDNRFTDGKKFVYCDGVMKDGHPDGPKTTYKCPPLDNKNDIQKFDKRYKIHITCFCTWNGTETVRTNVKNYDESNNIE